MWPSTTYLDPVPQPHNRTAADAKRSVFFIGRGGFIEKPLRGICGSEGLFIRGGLLSEELLHFLVEVFAAQVLGDDHALGVDQEIRATLMTPLLCSTK